MSLDKRFISVHHIGGRNGSRAFPVLKRFEKDIINVLYDADADCIEHIKERSRNLESRLYALPYCVYDSCRKAVLNINYDPFTSSLYDINPEFSQFYYFYGDHDYILSETCRTMEKRSIETVTIDHIFQSKDILIPVPDFLSLDTQGSEYDILKGGVKTLQSDVLAITLEAEFRPLYKGQKLFGDLTSLLSENGFYFAKFLGIHELSPFRAPVGFRGQGFDTFCDALFLKRLDRIDTDKDAEKSYSMLRKLAFIAFVFKQFEYGLECLKKSRSLYIDSPAESFEGLLYIKFLAELERRLAEMPESYPLTFASKYPTFEASRSRFEVAALNAKDLKGKERFSYLTKQMLRCIPLAYPILRWFKYSARDLLWKLSCLFNKAFSSYNDVEKLLIKYGLKPLAALLKEKRVIQARFSNPITTAMKEN